MHVAEMRERVLHLVRLHEDVEREVDARAAAVRDRARLLELGERELRALVARVELLDAQIHGVGAVRDGGADGVEGAGGAEEFGAGHASKDTTQGRSVTEGNRAHSTGRRVRRTTELVTH